MIGQTRHRPEPSPRLAHLLAAGAGIICILSGNAACSTAPAPVQPQARILIEFRDAVDGASPALLSRLERLAGIPIRYAASVSPKRHAYVLSCSADAPRCQAAMRSLGKDPAVAGIAPDRLRGAH